MPNIFSVHCIQKTLFGFVVWCCLFLLPNAAQSATSNSATLQWAANSESDLAGYRVYQGTTAGVYGLSTDVGKVTTYTISNLQSGLTNYFAITAYDMNGNESLPSPEVSKYIAGASSLEDSVTGTTSPVFPASIASPAPGSTLTSTSVTFTGGHTSQDLEHSLRIGTSNGASDIYSKSMGTSHSVTVSGLPSTGTIYVWYWTRNSNGWFVNKTTYAMNVGDTSTDTTSSTFPASIVSPAPGSTLTSTSVTFTGGHTSQDLEHSLRIGTSNGASDIYSKSMGTSHSVTVSGLPSTGTIYVWYWTRNSNGWFVNKTTYAMNLGDSTSLDVTPPSISLTSPTNGSNLSGTVTINTTATDNVGVVGVQFRLNGDNLGAEDTTSPFSISWDSSGVAPGPYAIAAIARDAAGNITSSAPLKVNISSPTSSLSVSIAGSGSVTSNPKGILCTSGTCSASYGSGSTISLVAKANKKWTFSGWSGACSGTGECVVRLSTNQSVKATFSENGNGRGNK